MSPFQVSKEPIFNWKKLYAFFKLITTLPNISIWMQELILFQSQPFLQFLQCTHRHMQTHTMFLVNCIQMALFQILTSGEKNHTTVSLNYLEAGFLSISHICFFYNFLYYWLLITLIELYNLNYRREHINYLNSSHSWYEIHLILGNYYFVIKSAHHLFI